MFDTVFGLPLHPLVVHATVVVVPSAALAVALAALWPRFRVWAGYLPIALAAAAVVLVPITTSSGESLERKVVDTELVREHAQMAEGLLPWALVLAVAAVGLVAIRLNEIEPRTEAGAGGLAGQVGRGLESLRSRVARRELPRFLAVAVIVVALVGAVGTTVQVVRIGHTGAQAAWSQNG